MNFGVDREARHLLLSRKLKLKEVVSRQGEALEMARSKVILSFVLGEGDSYCLDF